MKKLYTLFFTAIAASYSHGQAVLNEIYAFPSTGNHEFFELYNTSTSQTPVSVDGYVLISYFKEANKEGFYVMDLPNLSMTSKGYLVGSAAIPFNFQGNTNVTKSDFNWNDPVFRNGSTGGYIKRWVKGNTNLQDGNSFYDEEALPSDFNDFFDKRNGNGASFNAFLYKNGILVNSFVGGTGGTTFIPTFITSMPQLNFTNSNEGVISTYTVTYSSYTSTIPEYVTQDIGTDNGFIRKSDGMCGTWDKSSAQAFHTPQQPNGGSQMTVTGSLSINTHITRGINGDPSFMVYNITAGPSLMFPVQLYIYADNGTVNGQWDANDVFLEEHIENSVSDGPFTTYFTPLNQQLILVAKTAVGCYDQVRLVLNSEPPAVVLPVVLKQFTVEQRGDQQLLEWVVLNNELSNSFELERGINGNTFSKISTISAIAKNGEMYYSSSIPIIENAEYRIKVISKDRSAFYSNVVSLKQFALANAITILQNPVTSTELRFVFQSDKKGKFLATIYNSSGLRLVNTSFLMQRGNNTVAMGLENKLTAGIYLLEITNGQEKYLKRFIKH